MKLTILIMTLFLIQVSAKTNAQITIKEKNITLQKVLRAISTQSGYDFVYSNSDFKDLKPVSITLNNASINEALQTAFSGQPLIYEVSEKTVMVKRKEEKENSIIDKIKNYFSNITITGTVQDEKGVSLPGVNVKVKNGKGNTLTGTKGEFTLKNVDESSIIEFTYVGYKKKELPADEVMGFIRMELSDNKLDEVQIQFSGITSRRTSTSNIATIKAEEIAKQPVDNPLYALMGRVPGLIVTPTSGNFNAPVKVQLRGQNSLSKVDSEPLFVIDGVPFQNNIGGGAITETISAMSFVNPQDIESIDVLKDADATAIYGSRGANGVILITTKKGKVGSTKIDFGINVGFSSVPIKTKLLNTEQYLQMRREAFKNDGLPVPDPSIPNGDKNLTNFDLTVWDSQRYTDWQEVLFGGVGKNQQANLTVSGGSEFVRYSVNGTYSKNGLPFLGKNQQEMGIGSMSISANSPNQKLQISLNASYSSNESLTPSTDYTRIAFTLPPNAPALYNSDGSLNWEPNTGSTFGEATWSNPAAGLLQTKKSDATSINVSTNVSYEIIKGLKFTLISGFNKVASTRFSKFPIAAQDPAFFSSNTGSTSSSESASTNLSIQPQVNYQQTLGKGRIDLLIGGAYQKGDISDRTIIASGFTNDALLESIASAAPGGISAYNSGAQYKYAGGFFRASYNWDERYIVTANARRDGSSRFGPGERYGNFGSIGVAWIFTNESFLRDKNSILSFGKLRSSYGSNGNDQIGDYKYLELFGSLPLTQYQGRPVLISTGATNPDYHWEHKNNLEMGFDLGFFRQRLLISGSYFRSISNDQLLSYPLPATAGGTILLNQDAKIQNSGMELSIGSTNFSTEKFRWQTNLNLSFANKNKILALPLNADAFQSRLGNIYDSTLPINDLIGKPFGGVVAAYEFRGIDPGTGFARFADKDGNTIVGNIGAADPYARLIDLNPKFYGGISNQFTFKGVTLDIFLEFKRQIGRSIFSEGNLAIAGTNSNQPVEVMGRWMTPGDNSSFQKFSQNYSTIMTGGIVAASDIAYTDASFLRLKNISLSYEVPLSLKKILHLQSLTVFANAQNIATITKYKGADPETQSWISLPPLRTIQTGLRASF